MLVNSAGRRYMLSVSSVTLVGSKGCAVLLSEPGVPPQAARITPYGGGYVLEPIATPLKINGKPASGPAPLAPGDRIEIGAAGLTYQGPPTPGLPASPPPPPVISTGGTAAPIAPLVPPPPPAPSSTSPGVILKKWGRPQPTIEGRVELVDGPHRVAKGSAMGKMIAAAALAWMSHGLLTFLPFLGKQEIDVWYLRVTDHSTGKLVSVLMRGESTTLPQLGDFIAAWGPVQEGNVIMQRGYNYTTDSNIQLKA